jgi:S1-C subfamily serine protease
LGERLRPSLRPASARYARRRALALLLLATSAQADVSKRRSAVVEVVQKVSPAVVFIGTEQTVDKRLRGSTLEEFFNGRGPTRGRSVQSLGSGVLIDSAGLIVTNDHVIRGASAIHVMLADGRQLDAEVVGSDAGNDLAVLRVQAKTPLPTARLGTSADLMIGETVVAIGSPLGLQKSVTVGVLSAIGRSFKADNDQVFNDFLQTDAAINPGNSGGPAIAGDKMIGLAFSRLGGDTQNIGYIIPNEEVELFLKDIADGRYDGKPAMYDDLQTFENPALRNFLKLDKSVEGMVVHRPDQSDASYPLKEWDVITRVGDTPIDNQGMVKIDKDLRVQFGYMIQRVAKDGKLPLTVVRDGKPLKIELPVSANRPTLIPDLHGAYPSYFVYGPVVFSRATRQFLAAFENNANLLRALGLVKSPLVTRALDPPTEDLEELVLISSPFFPHKLANGYGNSIGSVVYSINGTPIKSLKHLVALLRDLKDPFVTIEFFTRGGEALVFSRTDIMAATDDILTDNGVRAQGSADMMEVWQPKPAN